MAGGGHAGKGAARAWLRQRILSAALVPLTIWFVIAVICNLGASYEEMRDWVSGPVTAILLIATFAVTFWHAALGGHEIIEDYVHGKAAGPAALANRLFNLALAVLSIGAVVLIVFGG